MPVLFGLTATGPGAAADTFIHVVIGQGQEPGAHGYAADGIMVPAVTHGAEVIGDKSKQFEQAVYS